MDRNNLINEIKSNLKSNFGRSIENASPVQLHDSIAKAVMRGIADRWDESKAKHLLGRRACYLSMEFLMGRAVYNNLLCLGIKDEVDEILKEHGRSLKKSRTPPLVTEALAGWRLVFSIPLLLMTFRWTAMEYVINTEFSNKPSKTAFSGNMPTTGKDMAIHGRSAAMLML